MIITTGFSPQADKAVVGFIKVSDVIDIYNLEILDHFDLRQFKGFYKIQEKQAEAAAADLSGEEQEPSSTLEEVMFSRNPSDTTETQAHAFNLICI